MTCTVLRVARLVGRGMRSVEALTGVTSLVILAIVVFAGVGFSITRQTARAAAVVSSAREPTVVARIQLQAEDRAAYRRVDPRSGIEPLFGPHYRADDGKPVYVCAFTPGGVGGLLPLIQQAGLDVDRGFHLALIPIRLSARYDLDAARVGNLLREGAIDCALTTLDAVALHGGTVTLIAGESAGADALWARGLDRAADLRHARIAVARGTASEFLAISALMRAGLDPARDAQLRRYDTPAAALAAFDIGDADAVAGRAPTILAAMASDGRPLHAAEAARDIVDVVATAPRSIAVQPDVVARFHAAWFDALSLQTTNAPAVAAHVARWGHPGWTGVNAQNAALDWFAQLRGIAQADVDQNRRVFADPAMLQRRIADAQARWREAGVALADGARDVDGRFVDALMPRPMGAFPNPSFALDKMAARAIGLRHLRSPVPWPTQALELLLDTTSADDTAAQSGPSIEPLQLAGCERVSFDPESNALGISTRATLDRCVSALIARQALVTVRVTGTSAWPGPSGRYDRSDIEAIARARAHMVADYMAARGIDRRYLEVRYTLPPPARRGTLDVTIQSRDRFVELTLLPLAR